MRRQFQKLARSIDPVEFIDCCVYLEAIFDKIKTDVGTYSYQKFADDLGIKSSSNLYKVVKGTRALGAMTAERLCNAIGLNGPRRSYFLRLVDLKMCKDSDERLRLLEDILTTKRRLGIGKYSIEQQELHREWYHFVVFEILCIPHVDQSAANIASLMQPRLRPLQVEKSIDLLIRLGIVGYNVKTARLEPCAGGVKTDAEAEGLLLLKYHHAIIELGLNAISEVPETNRDISTSTFRVSPGRIQKIKQAIYDLQMEVLANEPEPEVSNQVFQLNFQLFPVTQEITTASGDHTEGQQTKREPESA